MAKWNRHHNTKEIDGGSSIGIDPYVELIYPLANMFYPIVSNAHGSLGAFQAINSSGDYIEIETYASSHAYPDEEIVFSTRDEVAGFKKIDDENLVIIDEWRSYRFSSYYLSPVFVSPCPSLADTGYNLLIDALVVIAGVDADEALSSAFSFGNIAVKIEHENGTTTNIQQAISGLSARMVPIYTQSGDRINDRIGVYVKYDGPEFTLDYPDGYSEYSMTISVSGKGFDLIIAGTNRYF